MNILVVGGTGFIGTNLVQELAARDHKVTVLARSAEDRDVTQENMKTVTGDVTDYESIEGAFAGQDVVINLVALSPLFKPSGGDEMHDQVHLGGTKNVVRAAETHDVGRLVQMSAFGADPDGPTAYLQAKGQAEQVVQDSTLKWVIIRPSVIFGDGGEFIDFTKTLTTPYVTGLPGGGETRFQPLWVGDLVPMIAEVSEDDSHVGKIYELGGPDELSLAAVTKQIYQAQGTPVTIIPVPMPLAKLGLGIGEKLPGFPMGLDQYRSLQVDNTVEYNDIDAFGLTTDDLRSLSDYLTTGTSEPSVSESSSAWTAPSTLLVFGFLAVTWQLPTVIDIYSYGGIPGLLYIPAYLLMLVLYDSPWGLENIVYAIDPLIPGSGAYLWHGGLIVTYYLFAVILIWTGRQLKPSNLASTQSRGRDENQNGSAK